MWCTAGFFHAAGFLVTRDGEAVPLAKAENRAVCGFRPIAVTCDEDGTTRWREDTSSRDRFIFNVGDVTAYAEAMTRAMRRLLMQIE